MRIKIVFVVVVFVVVVVVVVVVLGACFFGWDDLDQDQ